MKIDHHRGPVTAVQVSQESDVLVTASHDATVCLWSLENYTLLNSIQLNRPVMNIQISCDSVSIKGNKEIKIITNVKINRCFYWPYVRIIVFI